MTEAATGIIKGEVKLYKPAEVAEVYISTLPIQWPTQEGTDFFCGRGQYILSSTKISYSIGSFSR